MIVLHAMRSGCLQSHHRGVSPMHHQCRNNNRALTSASVDRATAKPLGYPAHEVQHNMFASQHPGEPRVALYPSQRQLQQNVSALRHREDPQTSSHTAGFQYFISMGDIRTSQSSCHQMSREANGQLNSSASAPPQYNKQFLTTATEYGAQQSMMQFDSSRKFTNQCFNINPWKRSNTNNNTKLAQTQANPALSRHHSSAGCHEISHNTSESLLQHCNTNFCYTAASHVSVQTLKESFPLLASALSETSPNTTTSLTQTSNYGLPGPMVVSEASFQDKYCTPVNSAFASQEQGSCSISNERCSSSPFLSSRPILTDDQILDHVRKRLVAIMRNSQGSNGWLDSTKERIRRKEQKQSDCRSIVPKADSVANSPATFNQLEKPPRCSGGEACEEDSPWKTRSNAELSQKLKKKNDCTRSTPEKHSKGTPIYTVETSKDAHKNESVEKSTLDFDVKKQLDVTVSAGCDGKPIYSQDKQYVTSNDESFNTKWCHKTLKNELSTLPVLCYSLNALKQLVASLESIKAIAEMDNMSDTILKQYWNGNIDNLHVFTSTDYPQIMMSVAATCTKNEEESPVVLTAVSGMTLDDLVEGDPTSKSHEEYKSCWLNTNKNLDDIDQGSGVFLPLKCIPEKEGAKSLKPAAVVELNISQVVPGGVSEDFKANSRSVLSENRTQENQHVRPGKRKNVLDPQHGRVTGKEGQIHKQVSLLSSLNPSERRYKQTNHNTQTEVEIDALEAGDPVCSQIGQSTALSGNKREIQAVSGDKGKGSTFQEYLRDPQYEDVSEDESSTENIAIDSEPILQVSSNKEKESSFPPSFKVPEYENISDDESSQNQDVTVLPQSVTPLSECNSEKCPPGNQGAISDMELIPQKQVLQRTEKCQSAQMCCCPIYVETEDGFESQLCPKCETERQLPQETNLFSHSLQSKPSNEKDRMEAAKESARPTLAGLRYSSITKRKTSPCKVITKNDGLQYQKVTQPGGPQQIREPQHENVSVEISPQSEDLAVNEFKSETKTEDEMEDDWITIPIVISHLNDATQHGENGHKTRIGQRILTHSELYQSTSKAAPASTTTNATTATPSTTPTPTMEVFETLESYLQAKTNQLGNRFYYQVSTESEIDQSRSKDQEAVTKTSGRSTPSLEVEPMRKHSSSSETEDSSDYSDSSSELNFKIVSSQYWEKRSQVKTMQGSANLSSDKDVCVESESVSADGGFTDVKKQTNRTFSKAERDSSDQSDCLSTSTQLVQHSKTKRQKMSERKGTVIFASQTESKNDEDSRKKAKKRFLSRTGHSSDDQLIPQNQHSAETVKNQGPTAVTEPRPRKARLSEDSSLPHQSVDRVESPSIPDPVIARLVVQVPSDPTDHLKLTKATFHKQRKAQSSKPPTKTNEKNGTSNIRQKSQLQKDKGSSLSNKKADGCSVAHQQSKTSENETRTTVKNCKSVSWNPMLFIQDAPSTSTDSMASARRPPSSARESLASLSREGSGSSRTSHSESKQCLQILRNEWQKSYFPTRRDKKSVLDREEEPRTSPTHSKSMATGQQYYDAGREARPGPSHSDRLPRQRHSSHESATPLMKRTKHQAMLWTKARHREAQHDQRASVGEGYKWAEKTPAARKPKDYRPDRKKSRSCSMPTL
ncbi:uncharacterized protein LOC115355383 isoform X2 [Myripristis murdjan]|uniref:uncharacterized protein LOC115355383 isoform X2 n=1 Tax=Myripristis murdjan TaxID=586833 RepID=UPI001175E7AB|nr:uncharacterized protein LOC115355383 isoform X2 [Myripristis murdjan]